MHRQAAVAGSFYPSQAEAVTKFIEKHNLNKPKERAESVLVPHAGYIYSGAVAVRLLSSIEIPKTVILAGPNHTGLGADLSMYPEGSWWTPFGDVEIDDEAVNKLSESRLFSRDISAHTHEHSLEVILPILKYFRPDVKIVCLTMKYLGMDDIKLAASELFKLSEDKDFLFLVSSDFNHFEDSEVTEAKDKAAIDKIIEMDSEGLLKTVRSKNISMCGVIPASVGIEYCKLKKVETPVLIEHTHSGEVSGDNDRVVGYAGIMYKKV